MGKKSKQRSIARRISGVTMPIRRKRIKWNRNWKCLCGSNRKYKNCCMKDLDTLSSSDGNMVVRDVPEDVHELVNLIKEQQENEEETK